MPAPGLRDAGPPVTDSEGAEQGLEIPLDGVDAQMQLLGDFAVGPFLFDKAQDHLFAVRQARFRNGQDARAGGGSGQLC